uniref:DUF676 domain-containing protein n=1 Tax=Trichobilharzia regenti TaxID=157069 RepID=A0AA85JZU9_TRIRE|nr:unnamed protein product [Trichobilharzia regenti]
MPVVQATLSFIVELREFHNVDLYHRGYYQIRTYIKTNGQSVTTTGSANAKATAFAEPPFVWERSSTRFKIPEAKTASYIGPSVSDPAFVPEKACSKTLLIMYREESAKLCDVFEQRILIQVDPINLEDSLMKNDLFLCVELWFAEDPLDRQFIVEMLTKVSERQLRIHLTPSRGLNYHFTVFFDYFHLCAVELALYGALTNISPNIISCPKLAPYIQMNNPIVNLTQQTWHSILCSIKQASRHHFALAIHRHLCQILLAARESMLLFWRESIPYLPANVKPRIETVDFRSKLDSLTQITQALETDDDLANQISLDIARLSSQNTTLFKQLCKSVTLQSKLANFLRRRFHQIRMKRFAEAFFCQELSLANLLTIYDSSLAGHESLASDVRQSPYFQKLPTLPVTCRELDGDMTNLPIIFEDIFLPLSAGETKSHTPLSTNSYHSNTSVLNKIPENSAHKSSLIGDSSTSQKNRYDDNESGIYMEDEMISSQTSKHQSINLSRRDTIPCEDKKTKRPVLGNYLYPSTVPNLLAYQTNAISHSSPNLVSLPVRHTPVSSKSVFKPPLTTVTTPTTNHFNNCQSRRKFYPPGNHSRKFHYFDKSHGSSALQHFNDDNSKIKLVGYRSIRPLDNHIDRDSGFLDSRPRLTESSLNLQLDANHSASSMAATVRRPVLAIRDIRSRSLYNLSANSPRIKPLHSEVGATSSKNTLKSASLSLLNISSESTDMSSIRCSVNKDRPTSKWNTFTPCTNNSSKTSILTSAKSNTIYMESFPRQLHEVVALGTLKIAPLQPPGGCVPPAHLTKEADSLLPSDHFYKSRLGGSFVSLPSIPLSCTVPRVVSEGCLTKISSVDQFSWSKSRRRVKVLNLRRSHVSSGRKSQSNQLKTYTADLAYLGSCSDLQIAALEDELKSSNCVRLRNHSLNAVLHPSLTTSLMQERKRLTKSSTLLSNKEESNIDMHSISSSLSTIDIFGCTQQNNANRYLLSHCWPTSGTNHQCNSVRNHKKQNRKSKVSEDSQISMTCSCDDKRYMTTPVTSTSFPSTNITTSFNGKYQWPKSLTIGGSYPYGSTSENGTISYDCLCVDNSSNDKKSKHLNGTQGSNVVDTCSNKRSSNSSDCSHSSSVHLEGDEEIDSASRANNQIPLPTDSVHDKRLKECGYQIPDILSSDEDIARKNSPKLSILEMLNNEAERNGAKTSATNCKSPKKNNSCPVHQSVLPYKENNGYKNTLNGGVGGGNHLETDKYQSLLDILSPGVMEFLRLKEQVKREIAPHFQGHVYSDFATLAAPYAYFSDAPIFNEDVHLIICVHGLDGNSCDLRLVRVYLQLALPDCRLQFLMSECNQQDTFGGFEIMSEKLVNEIVNYIEDMEEEPKRISFIGHSMGCVIIRAALLDHRMKRYLSKLHTFLSLSGPHLGTVYNSSGLINMGIWVMQKIKKSESLSQLRLRDDPDLRNTYLYRLSSSPGLDLFRYVLLVGSPQDRYVPYHSTRIELCKAAIRDSSTLGFIYMEMVTNLLQRLIKSTRTTVVRYDVHYSLTNSANTLIGRAAHIAVLDSEIFLEKFICVSGAKYFR